MCQPQGLFFLCEKEEREYRKEKEKKFELAADGCSSFLMLSWDFTGLSSQPTLGYHKLCAWRDLNLSV